MIEVSSSDEEVDEVDEPDEETTTPTARGPRAEQTTSLKIVHECRSLTGLGELNPH